MKQLISFLSLSLLALCIIVTGLLQTGCEEAKGLEGLKVDSSSTYVSKAGDVVEIRVIGKRVDTPSFDTVGTTTVSNQTITTTTIQQGGLSFSYEYDLMALPFVWKVEDGSLGTIHEIETGYVRYTALSVRAPNRVEVKDQYGNVGQVVVRVDSTQAPGYALVLEASPATMKVGQASTISITSTDAQAPYKWALRSGPGRLTGASGSRSAAYTSDAIGTGVIEVSDANGAAGVIAVVVEAVAAGGGGGGTDPGGQP